MSASRDRLFDLLPAVYRQRDAAHGWPLRALLRVVGEQVDVLEADMARLYDNWFVETCEDWVVPYLGELVGYVPAAEAGRVGGAGAALDRFLVPRRDVGNSLRARRRRGTLAILERLSADAAQWPARAVELRRQLWVTANLRGAPAAGPPTPDLHDPGALARLGGAFDTVAHLPDVRRAGSGRSSGRPNIPGVGLFVWRLRTHSVTRSPAYCLEEVAPHAYTFSPLGNDTPLFSPWRPGAAVPAGGPGPGPVTRLELRRHPDRYYGEGKAFAIYTGPGRKLVRSEAIVVADLSGWRYRPRPGTVAVDPERGRFAFAPRHAPRGGVWVSFHQGFSADLGGGEYPVRRTTFAAAADGKAPSLYRVGARQRYARLGEALAAWRKEKPSRAVVEITDSAVYSDPVSLKLGEGQALRIRAARGARPVLRLLDLRGNRPDALRVTGAKGSALVLEGLLVTGRPVHAAGDLSCLILRHCTLVPGWALRHDCAPLRPAEPSLEVFAPRVCVTIEHSIVGSVQVALDEVAGDPVRMRVRDSIIDATGPEREAVGAPGCPVAHVALSIQRSTVFGRVQVHAIERAEDSVFAAPVRVARSQVGCMRFCYVPAGSRTPRRYACQPDGVDEKADLETVPGTPENAQLRRRERLRVRPRFAGVRYGSPRYARLADDCAPEVARGASDESEMGAFHDLFQPQRAATLRARLDEYTPAGLDAGVVYLS